MHFLHGAVRSYAWGSRTSLAELRGHTVPSEHPEAEIWLGAHPADPAHVGDGSSKQSLLTRIDEDPVRELGADTAETYEGRLPFLLKLLAADEPLSLQAHPSAAQAKEGFAREEELRVPIDSPVRNYRDASHKPELIVALTEFHALAGFRCPRQTVEFMDALGVEALSVYRSLLADQPDQAGLRTVFTSWITLPGPALDALLPLVADGLVQYLSTRAQEDGGKFVAEARTLLELGESYPGDAGVLAAMLLNRVTLNPGQGLFLAAGNLHAYLSGTGVEIMANSDNVLRGGLTPKHVDVPELLRVLDFEPAEVTVLDPALDSVELPVRYDTPAPEFALSRSTLADGSSVKLDSAGPQIVLCTDGRVALDDGNTELILERGASVWVPAADPVVAVHARWGAAEVFSATVG
ncbi:mannose-6-phosphate isomerase, class I [Rhodococcus sp. BP-252]|uniref:mannose-6-phosphate isomerase, class I n=1 Tax=unclassified Rhodococcus (in: high G+C Gram-positive bacteria) TaxID=192944 RepID=UPI00143064ED|nr:MULTISPECIES: mannose-6-phosphate isomerase, class I [unclassified Rhodococcus (in: high G+C Gram-positive bacteria)]NIL75453.1 Mannose-6-phosphate isomerase [Rhodococcus sp. B10]MBY6412462.1 mannose-6-phosphate isomerase, class I [Rhodococcus sp. BP-320]MBY6417042.1 mannose-6-phosphate isomerase, class I [Rhodococcus sp. BP-321]MBY6421995.1 mannose-6-phosphate isomerase, class I [Rhodococcus sp. BP-324]MBY6427066.1 mannose-6-phosphate isomerase, class I [Rhodococcus sp. BP-323]